LLTKILTDSMENVAKKIDQKVLFVNKLLVLDNKIALAGKFL